MDFFLLYIANFRFYRYKNETTIYTSTSLKELYYLLNDQLKYSNTINDRLIEYFNLCSDGEVIQSLTQYANEYFQDKKYLKAVGCYLKLLSYNPQNARIWNKLAVCFIQLGEYKTAEEMSRIAFKLINEEMID